MSLSDEHLPLTPAEFQVLLALAGGERHGYALMQDVRANTGGHIRLGPGTLYTLLDRLLPTGVIEESPRRPAAGEDQRRRYYRLTASGRAALEAETRRLESLVRIARRRLAAHV